MSAQFDYIPTSRAMAVLLGAPRYFTGAPCPKGHVADRRTNGGGCIECAKRTHAKYLSKPGNMARKLEKRAAWRSKPETKAKFRQYNKAAEARMRADPARYEDYKRKANMRRDGIFIERDVELYFVEAVLSVGGFCPKFVDKSRKGAPDRIVMVPGFPVYFVELKRPKRGIVAVHQVKYHAEIRRCGHEVFIIKNKHEIDSFMERYKR